MKRKRFVKWTLLIVAVLLVLVAVAPAAYAEWWDAFHVDITSANLSRVTMTYAVPSYWACNHFGRETGYLLYVGYGSTRSECRANASDNRVPNMTSTPYSYRWPFPVSQGFEPGDMACIFWCSQPIAPLMVFHWDYMDIDGAPWW